MKHGRWWNRLEIVRSRHCSPSPPPGAQPVMCTYWSLLCSDFGIHMTRHVAHYAKTWNICKTGSTLRFAVPPEDDWIMAVINMREQFGQVRPFGFADMREDRHTATLITILCSPLGGEVNIQWRKHRHYTLQLSSAITHLSMLLPISLCNWWQHVRRLSLQFAQPWMWSPPSCR